MMTRCMRGSAHCEGPSIRFHWDSIVSLGDKIQCSVIIVIMIVIVIMIISLMVDNITLSVCISIVTIAFAIIVTAINDIIMALSSQVAQPRLQVSNLSKK